MWCILAIAVVVALAPPCRGFNVGVKGTKCNLDTSKGDINDPCESLYGAVCGGTHCTCPPGTFEDKTLLRCSKNRPGGSQGGNNRGAVDDLGLPFDYEPNKPAPAPAPPKPKPPQQPQPGYNPNQPGYNPNQPGYNPNQPGYNPNQPGYNPNQPGYNPNQPGYNPNQPGYNPNQPGYNPNQPGGTHGKTRGKDKDHMGEEVGGGVGGLVFLLIMGGLVYFCCCRGGKHKQVMNRFQGLPFMNRGQQAAPGGAVPMQSAMVQQDPNFSSQHTYVPPDSQQPPPGQYPPPAGVYPAPPYGPQPGYAPYPPQGYPPPGQQPPPYTQQYQPNAPPPM